MIQLQPLVQLHGGVNVAWLIIGEVGEDGRPFMGGMPSRAGGPLAACYFVVWGEESVVEARFVHDCYLFVLFVICYRKLINVGYDFIGGPDINFKSCLLNH